MAIGEKYRFDIEDINSQKWRVSIYKQGFAGSVTEYDNVVSALSIDYTQDDDKYSPIKGSSAKITIQDTAGFTWREFVNNSEKEFEMWIQRYNTGTASYDLYWQGYVVPDQYTEAYLDTPYPINLVAIDGLSILKNVDYSAAAITEYYQTNRVTMLSVITKLFDSVGGIFADNLIPFTECVNIYETNINSTSTDSPLDQIYVEEKVFFDKIELKIINGGEYTYNVYDPKSCYEVLEIILRSLGARIWQGMPFNEDRNYWNIERVSDKNDSVFRRRYTSAGVYVETKSVDYWKEPAKGDETAFQFRDVDHSLDFLDTLRKAAITFKAGQTPYADLVPDGEFEFEAWDTFSYPYTGGTGTLNRWTKSDPGLTLYPRLGVAQFSRFSCGLGGSGTDYIESEHVAVTGVGNVMKIILSARVRATATVAGYDTTSHPFPIIAVKCGTKWLQDDDTWGASFNTYQIGYRKPVLEPEFKNWVIETTVPEDGDIFIRLYQCDQYSCKNQGGAYTLLDAETCDYDDVKIEYLDSDGEFGYESIAFNADADTVSTLGDYEQDIYLGDGAPAVNIGALTYSTSIADETTTWARRGVVETLKLTDLLAKEIAKNYSEPSRVLSGTFNGDYVFNFDNLLKLDEGTPGTPDYHYYFCSGASYDILNNAWNGRWIENFSQVGAYASTSPDQTKPFKPIDLNPFYPPWGGERTPGETYMPGFTTDDIVEGTTQLFYGSDLPEADGYLRDGGNTFGEAIEVGTQDAYSLIFRTNNTDQAEIDSSGKFGLGISSPAAQFTQEAPTSDSTIIRRITDSGTNLIEVKRANGVIRHTIGASGDYFEFNDTEFTISRGTARLRLDASSGSAREYIFENAGNVLNIQNTTDDAGGVRITNSSDVLQFQINGGCGERVMLAFSDDMVIHGCPNSVPADSRFTVNKRLSFYTDESNKQLLAKYKDSSGTIQIINVGNWP